MARFPRNNDRALRDWLLCIGGVFGFAFVAYNPELVFILLLLAACAVACIVD